MTDIAPAYVQELPGNAPYITNLTVASTLVCEPHIQFMPRLARALGGFVDLSSVPVEYSAGIGNMDQSFVAWMVYNYAVQQARDIVGIFRPYIFFGQATGNAILRSDPNNPASGTVPRSTTDIGSGLLFTYVKGTHSSKKGRPCPCLS